jgi:hypothetical protein
MIGHRARAGGDARAGIIGDKAFFSGHWLQWRIGTLLVQSA